MRGLEEELEYDEDSVEFQRRVALNLSLIVIAVASIVKDVNNFVNNKPLDKK